MTGKFERECLMAGGLGIARCGVASLGLEGHGQLIHKPNGTQSCVVKRNKTMKKLMIAASAALCATVGLCVESANVVG